MLHCVPAAFPKLLLQLNRHCCLHHCRYLAVRCGLAVAVELDVSGQQERMPLGRLQPASLTATYQFLPKLVRLSQPKVRYHAAVHLRGLWHW